MGYAEASAFLNPAPGETRAYISAQDLKNAFSQIYTDANNTFLLRSGGTMVGPLIVPSPAGGANPVTKTYAETNYLQKSGGTMVGNLTIPVTPTNDAHAASKLYVDKFRPGRNLIDNSEMKISQRGTSINITQRASTIPESNTLDNIYANTTLDRWKVYNTTSVNSTAVVSQQTNTSPTLPFSNFLRYAVGATPDASMTTSEYVGIEQNIEGFNVDYAGLGQANYQPLSISFWVRASVAATYAVSLTNYSREYSYIFTYTIAQADIWQLVTHTVTAAAPGGTWYTDTFPGLSVRFAIAAGVSRIHSSNGQTGWVTGNYVKNLDCNNVLIATAAATFDITGVQVEVGSNVTPFEYTQYSVELDKCQRYFQRYNAPSLHGVCSGATTVGRLSMPLVAQMRTTPSCYMIGNLPLYNALTTGVISTIGTQFNGQNAVEMDVNTATNFTTGNPVNTYYNGAGTYLDVSAEI